MAGSEAMVIVGSGEAGVAAAMAIRSHGWTGRIVMISRERSLPYERPPLSKIVLTEEHPVPRPILPAEAFAELQLETILGAEVDAVVRSAKCLRLADGSSVAYHRLLLATGASPRRIDVPVPMEEKIVYLRTFEDALAIRKHMSHRARIVIVGGGFIGLETASSCAAMGASVTVLEGGPRLLMRAVPAGVASLIEARHEQHGVHIVKQASVDRFSLKQGLPTVALKDGREFHADLVIVGIGAVPNVEIAQAAGLAVDNGICVDSTLRTEDSDIFAAGDCCSFPSSHAVGRTRLEVWRNARRQGAVAGANMAGASEAYDEVPWFWSDQYDDTLQIVGICDPQQVQILRNLGEKGQIFFFTSQAGVLAAACGYGQLGAVAKEIRVAETLIKMRVVPDAAALADPQISLKSMLR